MRVRTLSVLAVAAVALSLPTVVRAQTPDGDIVFRGNCATCHDGAAASRDPAPVVVGGMMDVNSGDYRARPGNVLLAYDVD